MGLIDFKTLALAISLTLILTLGTALFWKRIYRKGFPNLFLRLFLIILCQVLAISSVGLAVNRSNGFFETWSDLFGSGSNYTSVATTDSQLARISSADIKKGTHLPSGAVAIRDVITGRSSGVSNMVYLYLPKSALSHVNSGTAFDYAHYQVVEFLTGFPSQPVMWFKVMQIDKEIANYNASHPTREIIGVFPQINLAGNYDLECMDLPHGKPKAETWLSTDMRAYLDKRLGTMVQKWSLLGLSTGGWCSAMLSIKHPDLYAKAISIAGYYRPALPLTDPIALQNWAKKAYALDQFEKKLTQKMRMYLFASLGDRYSIKETRKFLALSHPNLDIKYHEIKSGGHNPHVWVAVLKPALDWL